MKTRIAVIGAEGQLGNELVAVLRDDVQPLTHRDLDLTRADQLREVMDRSRPDVVVNCAAYNLVDGAEDEPEAAFAVNAFGVRHLARWCGDHDVPLMHLSTDHVFGQPSPAGLPHRESDLAVPVSVYGASKLAGEWFVQSECSRWWIVRTCGLYGQRATRAKGNFVETMLRLGEELGSVRVVSDQRCTPTSAADLAGIVSELLSTNRYGIYHATNAGSCTWHEFACEIFRQAGLSVNVEPITSAEFAAKARRPVNSVLDGTRLTQVLGRSPRSWQEALAEYLTKRATS